MAACACPQCGLIGEVQPCAACGGATFELGDASDREALRLTLARKRQQRAGIAGLVGFGMGIGVAVCLDASSMFGEPLPYAFAIALATATALMPSRTREVERELEARCGGHSRQRLGNAVACAAAVLVIALRIGGHFYAEATTMPRADALRMVSTRTCDIAKRCTKAPLLCDVTNAISVELAPRRARLDRDVVESCLDALADSERRHEACTAPAPPACQRISPDSVPSLLRGAEALERDIGRSIDEQLRRAPPR